MKPKNPCMKETCRHHDWRGFGRCPYCKAKDKQLKRKGKQNEIAKRW